MYSFTTVVLFISFICVSYIQGEPCMYATGKFELQFQQQPHQNLVGSTGEKVGHSNIDQINQARESDIDTSGVHFNMSAIRNGGNIRESCKELYLQGNRISGVYKIQPKSMTNPIAVLCDMESRGGGWTYIQKRFDNSQEFDLSWQEYKDGFGDIEGEFWIGLDKIYQMTKNDKNELLVEFVTEDGKEGYAWYAEFGIGPESTRYNLTTAAGFRGNVYNCIASHVGLQFSTKDSDSPAPRYNGGWWTKDWILSNLNGPRLNSVNVTRTGTFWYRDRGYDFLSKTKMLIRPVQ